MRLSCTACGGKEEHGLFANLKTCKKCKLVSKYKHDLSVKLFECANCGGVEEHEVQENIKICEICHLTTSYKYDPATFRKRLKEEETEDTYSGELSPYWEWVENRAGGGEYRDSVGEYAELAEANPDQLSEESTMWPKCSESDKENFDAIISNIDKLSRREKEVVQLLWENKKTSEVAVILMISEVTVRKLLQRARKKLQSCTRKQV